MAKDRSLEVDSLQRQVYDLTVQLKEAVSVMAEHVYDIRVGDLVYVCDGGTRADELATVESLGPREAQVKFGGESLCVKVDYRFLVKSKL